MQSSALTSCSFLTMQWQRTVTGNTSFEPLINGGQHLQWTFDQWWFACCRPKPFFHLRLVIIRHCYCCCLVMFVMRWPSCECAIWVDDAVCVWFYLVCWLGVPIPIHWFYLHTNSIVLGGKMVTISGDGGQVPRTWAGFKMGPVIENFWGGLKSIEL